MPVLAVGGVVVAVTGRAVVVHWVAAAELAEQRVRSLVDAVVPRQHWRHALLPSGQFAGADTAARSEGSCPRRGSLL